MFTLCPICHCQSNYQAIYYFSHAFSLSRTPSLATRCLVIIMCKLHTAMHGNMNFFVELPHEWLTSHTNRQLTGMRGNTSFTIIMSNYTVCRMYIKMRQRVGVVCFQICSCAQNQRGKKLSQYLVEVLYEA